MQRTIRGVVLPACGLAAVHVPSTKLLRRGSPLIRDPLAGEERRVSMPLAELSDGERLVVLECLRASVDGPFFPEWEFKSLFGIARSDLAGIVTAWPNVDERLETVGLAISNSMNNLLGYPHRCDQAWFQFLSVPKQEVERILIKWREGAARASS